MHVSILCGLLGLCVHVCVCVCVQKGLSGRLDTYLCRGRKVCLLQHVQYEKEEMLECGCVHACVHVLQCKPDIQLELGKNRFTLVCLEKLRERERATEAKETDRER